MRRVWVWGVSSLVVLVGLFLGWWCYVPNVRLTGSLRDEENLPFVKLQDVQSGKLARYLRLRWLWQDWFGMKPAYYQVQKFDEFRPYISDTYGLNGVALSVGEMAAYYQEEKLPYKFVAFFTTKTDKEQYLVAVQKWYGKAGKNRLIIYLTPLPSALPGAYGDVWMSALGNDGAVAATPVLYWRDLESCMSITNNRGELCDYMLTQNVWNGWMMRRWIGKNVVPSVAQYGAYWMYVMGRPRE